MKYVIISENQFDVGTKFGNAAIPNKDNFFDNLGLKKRTSHGALFSHRRPSALIPKIRRTSETSRDAFFFILNLLLSIANVFGSKMMT